MSSSPEAGTSGGAAAAAAAEETLPPPPEVGARVLWQREGKLIPAEIVERRAIPSGSGEYEYYVHCTDSDGSLGVWVKSEQLDLGSEGADADEQTDDKGHEEFDTACVQQCLQIFRTKRIVKIGLDGHEIDMPLRSSVLDDDNSKLYVCEFCLDFKEQKGHLERHMESCHLRHPPGTEIYKNGNLSVFEVDGKEEVYTRKLCMLANLFVPNKAPEPAVEYFLFYILCEYDDQGYHMAAYFSKNKHVEQNCNLSCILTFPPFRQKGYATFLIELSYEFTKREGKAGGPERPLSELGQLSYSKYWTRVLVNILKEEEETLTVEELSESTGIAAEDVLDTLKDLGLIKYREGIPVIRAYPNILNRHRLRPGGVRGSEFDASKLIWTPYHMRSR